MFLIQPALDEVVQQCLDDVAVFGVVFPQPQHLLLALCIDAERAHDRVVAQDDPIDQHDREVTIPEWRGEPAGRGARRTRSRAARPPAPTDCGREGGT